MSKILIVEDDQNLGSSLSKNLEREGYDISWASSLESARDHYSKDKFDLVILDWMLPDGQGVDLLKELREEKTTIPVIMLTARTDLIDKVIGLESGANDYMTKPFEPRELIARIRVQLRNPVEHEVAKEFESIIQGDLKIDMGSREITFKNNLVDMTKMEFELIKLLAETPNRAFSREEILNKVWGYENYPTTRTVDTHVLQLRQKLDEKMIETVRGVGYRFRCKSSD